ncbi:MAG: cyclic nucleotide-binding domain-containing protein [Pseudomonadota bacterium]
MIEALPAALTEQPTAELLVYAAMLLYVAGFVLKDQILLRAFILTGTGFYIAYYYVAPESPLWAAIYASLAIGAANVIGFVRLVYGRMRMGIPESHRAIFAAMGGLRPGEFRRLMRLGEYCETEASETLTREGRTPDWLYFIVKGEVVATKGPARFVIPPDHFVGEISFYLGRPATACVAMPKGGAYVRWDRARLRRAMARSFELERAVEALLTRDMAGKVAAGVRIETPLDAPMAA